jgi:hypothetical protein
MTSTLGLTNSAANDGQRDRDLSRAGAARACFRVCQVSICQARRLAATLGGDPEEAHGKPRKNHRTLAEFAATLRYDDLPERNREPQESDFGWARLRWPSRRGTGQVIALASALAQGNT